MNNNWNTSANMSLFDMSLKLQHPFTLLVAGPSSSGKSWFTSKIIKHGEALIHPPPDQILWIYGEWQDLYSELRNVEFFDTIPDLKTLNPTLKTLIVVDDLMGSEGETISELFTRGSHHRNISIIYIVQNLFDNSKHHRTISLNAHYISMFKNPRDTSQINHLAKQMFPSNVKFMREAYVDATSSAHGYLFIDLKQNTPEEYRLRTNIFPDEVTHVYVKKR